MWLPLIVIVQMQVNEQFPHNKALNIVVCMFLFELHLLTFCPILWRYWKFDLHLFFSLETNNRALWQSVDEYVHIQYKITIFFLPETNSLKEKVF